MGCRITVTNSPLQYASLAMLLQRLHLIQSDTPYACHRHKQHCCTPLLNV
jgi:hypothetical protein